ncbi:MAG: hypothetical protein ACRBBW_17165 [Cellvibrionaceae bacterium]
MTTSTVTSAFPSIQLTADQLMHFTGGDGLHLRNPQNEIIAFIHETNLDNPLELNQLKETQTEVREVVTLIESLVINQSGYLELNEEATQGLGTVLGDLRDKLTY